MSDEEKEQRRQNVSKAVRKHYEELNGYIKSDVPKKKRKPKKKVEISEEERLKRKFEAKQRGIAKLKEYWANPENKKKHSEKLKRYFRSPEGIKTRKKLAEHTRKQKTGVPHSKEHRAKISESISKKIVEGKGYFGYYKYSKCGHHESPKAGRVYHRSAFEKLSFEILDKDDNVSTYQVEKVRIRYKFEDGSIHYYIPDLKVFYQDGNWEIIEIRPFEMIKHDELKFNAARQKFGNKFKIWSEKELGLDNSWDAHND